jgi:hypothetical protein
MLKLIRSAAVALMLIPTTSSAEDFGVGMAAYRAGDFATALSEWTPLAEQGSADAQFFLGTMHDKGEGVPPEVVSDQCEPVSVCPNPLGFRPRRVDATLRERRRDWP